MKFNGYEESLETLEKLVKEWDVRANLFYRIVKDKFLTATNGVSDKIKQKELQDIFDKMSDLGGSLEEMHTRLQDLGSLYNKMRDLIKDKI